MFDRFTDRARKTMGLARQEAQRLNHDYIGTEHILLGLVQVSGVAASVLESLDVDLPRIRREIERLVSTGTAVVTSGQLPFTPRSKKVLEFSLAEASGLGHTYIGTEHLLLGLIRENEGIAAQVLRNLEVKAEDVRQEVLKLLSDGDPPHDDPRPAHRAIGRAYSLSPSSFDPATADGILLEHDANRSLRAAYAAASVVGGHVDEVTLLCGILAARAPSGRDPVAEAAIEGVRASIKDAAARKPAVPPHSTKEESLQRRFEPGALSAIGRAFTRAAGRGASRASADDLLFALLADDAGLACQALRAAGVDPAAIRPPA